MLQVRSLGNAARYATAMSTSLPGSPVSITVGHVIPYPYNDAVASIKGRISTGGSDEFGDRSCSHVNVTGELLVFPNSIVTVGSEPIVLSPSYVLLEGNLGEVPTLRVKRSNGTWIDVKGYLLLSDTSFERIVYRDVKYREFSNPLKLTEFSHYAIFVHSEGGVNEFGVWYRMRTSSTGGASWTAWTERRNVMQVVKYNYTSPPTYQRYTSGVWGAPITPSIILASGSAPMPSSGTLSGDQATALDYWLAAGYPGAGDVWGDLCVDALQDARALSINTGMYLYELSQIAKSAKGIYSLVKGKWSYKTLASLYLTNRYGVQLTMADTLSIIDAAKRELQDVSKSYNWVRSQCADAHVASRGRFSGYDGSAAFHYKVYYRPYDHWFAKGLKALMDIDLAPTLTNTWDLVPFSFVIDWFLDIGSLFERIDTRTYASTLSVLGVLRSIKRSVGSLPGLLYPFWNSEQSQLVGQWGCTSYQRASSPTLDIPQLILDTPREFKNYAELAAIIAQKL